VISTRDDPDRNSRMMTSRVFWSMSPCVADTVWSRSRILSVNQSTLRRVLAKMTDWVMASVSYRSHRVSSFHSSRWGGGGGGRGWAFFCLGRGARRDATATPLPSPSTPPPRR
jgi:hypothetical protein